MSSFFAKTNMENIFNKCVPLMDRLLSDKLKPRVKNGSILDLHEQFTMIFSALPSVMGMDCPMGRDEPEEIGEKSDLLFLIFHLTLECLIGSCEKCLWVVRCPNL